MIQNRSIKGETSKNHWNRCFIKNRGIRSCKTAIPEWRYYFDGWWLCKCGVWSYGKSSYTLVDKKYFKSIKKRFEWYFIRQISFIAAVNPVCWCRQTGIYIYNMIQYLCISLLSFKTSFSNTPPLLIIDLTEPMLSLSQTNKTLSIPSFLHSSKAKLIILVA